MLTTVLSRSILLFLITTCVAISLQSGAITKDTATKQLNPKPIYPEKVRVERGLFFHKKKSPGIIGLLAGIILEQWTDTRNTITRVNKLVNDNFLPEPSKNSKTELTTTTTPASTENSDPSITTTPMPFKITRTELNRILRRNVKGLVRLFNIELRDALKQSRMTDREFRKNASIEFSKYLFPSRTKN